MQLRKGASRGPLKICTSHDTISAQNSARHFDKATFITV